MRRVAKLTALETPGRKVACRDRCCCSHWRCRDAFRGAACRSRGLATLPRSPGAAHTIDLIPLFKSLPLTLCYSLGCIRPQRPPSGRCRARSRRIPSPPMTQEVPAQRGAAVRLVAKPVVVELHPLQVRDPPCSWIWDGHPALPDWA